MELITQDTNESFIISKTLSSCKFNKYLIHQIIVAYSANNRSNTSMQKNRSRVQGSNKKPWKQKGTGRARAGSVKSPLWRSGGVTFGGQIKNFHQKINKKMFRLGLRGIFSLLFSLNRILLFKRLELIKPKTKLLINYLSSYKIDRSILIIENNINNNIKLASRNLHNVNICKINNINPLLLLKVRNVLLTLNSLNLIDKILS